jgi:hypothetical protein
MLREGCLMHDFRDSEGYYHRIDAVPNLGREVRIKTTDGRTIDALVIMARSGSDIIGGDVAYQADDGEVISARNMQRWRYS